MCLPHRKCAHWYQSLNTTTAARLAPQTKSLLEISKRSCLQLDQGKSVHNLLGAISAKFHIDQMHGRPNIKYYLLKQKTTARYLQHESQPAEHSRLPGPERHGYREEETEACPGRAGLFCKSSTSSGGSGGKLLLLAMG